MADQASKEEKNKAKNTNDNETKTEESVASPKDAIKDTTKSNDKSPTKPKTPVKEKKAKKESKKEKEESDEESDDEELVGTLDAPLVVEGKRVRKSTEFLCNSLSKPQSAERKKIEIPEGKGETLGSMPRVQFQLAKVVADELKPLHRVLFGRPGYTAEVKRNIRAFNGFNIEKGSIEYKKKEEQIDRFTLDSIKRLCEILDVEKKGKKEEMLERIMDFLLLPKASGKHVPEPRKKGSAAKKSTKKRKRPPKETKGSSKKSKSDEIVHSDSEEDEDEDKDEDKDEEEEKPPAKKSKSPPKKEKKETKKPAKKEKKVVSIKISPGKKAKKAKESKPDSDSSDEEPLIKKTKKTPPTNNEIVELVKELLDGADLEKITMKSVCKQVYERFPDFDLTDRKEFIKDSVKEIIT